MNGKYKFSSEILNLVGLSKNMLITEKKMFDAIISKCTRHYNYYQMPKSIYLKLVSDNWLINNANNTPEDYISVRPQELKSFIKKLPHENDNEDTYISITSIYSNHPVLKLQVVI